MKILLLGRNGQLGWELQRSLAPLGQVLALDRHSPLHCGDLSQPQALVQTVLNYRPDIIVNAAAHTAVDQAEAEPELVHLINAEAPGALAQAAQKIGAWLVHYSTDYVFNGQGQTPWQESDAPDPLSVYGQSKLAGEALIAASGCAYLIFRTSWVYARRGGNFAKTMLRLAQQRERLTVIDDQLGAPTGADLIADVTAQVIRQFSLRAVAHNPEQKLAQNQALAQYSGIYHLVAAGHTSWHGYAQHVIERARELAPERAWAVQEIAPVASTAFVTAARRPHNSRLLTEKLQTTWDMHLPNWQLGVDRMLAEILLPT